MIKTISHTCGIPKDEIEWMTLSASHAHDSYKRAFKYKKLDCTVHSNCKFKILI